jgi:hypothetical protein
MIRGAPGQAGAIVGILQGAEPSLARSVDAK